MGVRGQTPPLSIRFGDVAWVFQPGEHIFSVLFWLLNHPDAVPTINAGDGNVSVSWFSDRGGEVTIRTTKAQLSHRITRTSA